jgi:hypothetical protein
MAAAMAVVGVVVAAGFTADQDALGEGLQRCSRVAARAGNHLDAARLKTAYGATADTADDHGADAKLVNEPGHATTLPMSGGRHGSRRKDFASRNLGHHETGRVSEMAADISGKALRSLAGDGHGLRFVHVYSF